MMRTPTQSFHVIVATLAIALALTILPLPATLAPYRPEWAALVLLYWVMALPQRVGVGAAWVVGLCLDVLKGALLGQHALALTLAALVMAYLHLRLRMYPFWQQSVMVGLILLVYQALLLWIYDMTSTATVAAVAWDYWLPSLVGAALWPWLYMLLRRARITHKVE